MIFIVKIFLTFKTKCNEEKLSAILFGWSVKQPRIGSTQTLDVTVDAVT